MGKQARKECIMERYDYRKAIKEDIKENLYEGLYEEALIETHANGVIESEEIYQYLLEKLWVDDSVTGNASGSYYCNAWKAEEALCHNLDLMFEVADEFGIPERNDWRRRSPEFWDVSIRCYLLGSCLREALDEYLEEVV